MSSAQQQHATATKATKGQGYRGRPKATATRGLRERAWWVIREKRKFTVDLLLDTVATGEEGSARNNLVKFLRRLEAVGIIARSAHRVPGEGMGNNGYAVWRLVRDIGRQAPVCRRAGQVYDPNAQALLAASDAVIVTDTYEVHDE